jgi:hypothetical protein
MWCKDRDLNWGRTHAKCMQHDRDWDRGQQGSRECNQLRVLPV